MTITAKAVRRMRTEYGVTVLERRQWTLNPFSLAVYGTRRRTRAHFLLPDKPADTLWAHITVTYNYSNGKPKSLKQIAREVHQIGMSRFESGISYNLLLHPTTGIVALGQALDAKGTHTVNDKRIPGYSYDQNGVSLAVAVVGMPGDVLSDKAFESFAKIIAALIDVGALTEGFDFNPHSMVAYKDCPTNAVRDRLPAIRERALELRKCHR